MMDSEMRRDGFTMLEIMIALVITSLVLSMVYSSFSAVMGTRERVGTMSELNMTARLILTRMSREIESAFIAPGTEEIDSDSRYTIFEGTQNFIENRPADRVSFTAFAHTKRGIDADESDQTLISYDVEALVEEGSEEEQLALIRRESRRLTPPGKKELHKPRAIPLAENIQGLRLRYLDPGGAWAEEWDSTKSDTLDLLPAAVEITLTLRDERNFDYDYVTVVKTRIEPFDRRPIVAQEGETSVDDETGEGEGDGEAAPTEEKAKSDRKKKAPSGSRAGQ
jgi:general secretion pathway protein J